ncbi:MAG: hypothetical protein HQK52_09435 [Oligoflexia bacterium]|nr:hypothetical protein [Oligoflexia bacterium]
MFVPFFRYFFSYIFFGKHKQGLLRLALIGLTLSSMALLILQSTMGGLQRNLITRSKNINGHGFLRLPHDLPFESAKTLVAFLRAENLNAFPEYEIELLLRHQGQLAPAIVHGLDPALTPPFLENHLASSNGGSTIIGSELAYKLRVGLSSQISLISPSHTNSILEDIPRQVTTFVDESITTDVPENDAFHLWTRLSLITNLTHERLYNRIRIYTPFEKESLQTLLTEKSPLKIPPLEIVTWEQENDALVWAMNLETKVMIFLFIIMTMLVGVAITSGLMLFFEKIQLDLVSFWLLGSSKKQLTQGANHLIHLASALASILGLLLGAAALLLLDRYAPNLMPDIFVDQKIPVHITLGGVLLSFAIPYLMAILFSSISLGNFKRDTRSFTEQIRSTVR